MLKSVQSLVPARLRPAAKRVYRSTYGIVNFPMRLFHRSVITPALLLSRSSRQKRKLEIGPGTDRIEGFETLNVVMGSNVDYVCNASGRLPFRTGSFDVVYASHILEHIPWYLTQQVLAEWIRIVAPGGRLELWVPDGLKICKAFVEAEENNSRDFESDGWFRFNAEKDPCRWASGRVFSYGDGLGTLGHQNWHLALFSYRYLEKALKQAGCREVEKLNKSQVRGHDHGWINMGIAGTK